MANLPKRAKQHVSEDKSLSILKLALPDEWIIRHQPTSDYGIDVEIEIAHKEVTGIIFKGQVRSKTPIKWRKDGTFREPVGEDKLFYWRNVHLPVILFLIDNENESVYWCKSVAGPPADLKLEEALIVEQENVLPDTIQNLKEYVRSYLNHKQARRVLNRLPLLIDEREKREELRDLDYFLPLDDEDYIHIQYYYEEILALRDAVGLSNSNILPWKIWVLRSQKLLGNDGYIYWGIHDEILDYINPKLDEAIEKVESIIEGEPPGIENSIIKTKLSDSGIGYSVSFTNQVDYVNWEEVESHIEEEGNLHFRLEV